MIPPDAIAAKPAQWRARTIPPAEREAHFAEVVGFQAEQARRSRSLSRIAWTLAGIAIMANVALSIALAGLLPTLRIVPLLIAIHRDGTADTAFRLSDLPPTQSAAVVRAAVWQYVRYRAGYDFADARYSYDLVSAMSAPAVRAAYQRYFLTSSNPRSPQLTVGRKGQIDVSLINLSFVRRDTALVRYRRAVRLYGENDARVTTWTATVGIRLDHAMTADARLVDPGGIVVTSYQADQDTPQPQP